MYWGRSICVCTHLGLEDTMSTYQTQEKITSPYEMNAILDVFMESEYYSQNVFGSRDFMRAQWIAHNKAYELASSGQFGFKVAQILSGSENPIESADVLDIRSLNNIGRKGTFTYNAIHFFGY